MREACWGSQEIRRDSRFGWDGNVDEYEGLAMAQKSELEDMDRIKLTFCTCELTRFIVLSQVQERGDALERSKSDEL